VGLISTKLFPCQEAPLVTSAVAPALFSTFLAIDRVLIVVTAILCGILTIGTVGGSVVVATVNIGIAIRSVVVVAAIVVVVTVATDGEVNNIIN